MKFLCVPCDSPMKLQTVEPPEGGSLSIVYACPECGYEMAMLTNAYETQVVQSLGVRIGPEGDQKASGSGCPFTAMIPGDRRGSSRHVRRTDPRPVDCRRRSAAFEHPRVRSPHGADGNRTIRPGAGGARS